MKFHDIYAPKGVLFVGLSPESDDRLSDMQKFLRDVNVPWPMGYDSQQAFFRYQVNAIPAIYVIDRDGKVAWHSDLEHDESLGNVLSRLIR